MLGQIVVHLVAKEPERENACAIQIPVANLVRNTETKGINRPTNVNRKSVVKFDGDSGRLGKVVIKPAESFQKAPVFDFASIKGKTTNLPTKPFAQARQLNGMDPVLSANARSTAPGVNGCHGKRAALSAADPVTVKENVGEIVPILFHNLVAKNVQAMERRLKTASI